ncbi:MAG TPA: tetratricopeptide repeat protein [Polyangiaceae bacterium]|nr:tetratricopeptide repeat protein [Polyangiaceae bacterium]
MRHRIYGQAIDSVGRAATRALLVCASAATLACIPPLEEPKTAQGEAAQAPPSDELTRKGLDAIKAKDYAKAKQFLAEARKANPKDAQNPYYLGVAEQESGNRAGAIAAYRECLALDPKFTEASINLGAILLEGHNPAEVAESVKVSDEGLKHNPKSADLAKNKAVALADSGDFAAAAEAYKKLMEAAPQDLRLRYDYARILSDSGKIPEAIAALKPVGESTDVKLLNAAGSLNAQLGAYEECVTVFDKVIQAGPNVSALVNRGNCKRGLKDLKAERADYEQALQIDPNYAPAHLSLGLNLFYVGKDRAQAIAELQKAKQLGQGTPVAEEADKMLAELDRASGKKKKK